MVKARYSLPSNVRDDHRHHQDSSIVARVKRQKVILLGSGAMNSLSLDAVVTEICREMDSEEGAFAGDRPRNCDVFSVCISRERILQSWWNILRFYRKARKFRTLTLAQACFVRNLSFASYTMYPYSIFVVNHSRRHYLQFHHPLMRMFSSLQPSKRRHLKSSTRCHSPTSISWSRSSAKAWISCPEMCHDL